MELDTESALLFTKFYTKEHELERTELLIQSPYLVSALQEVITEYPGVDLQSRAILVNDLPECIFHYRAELQSYGGLLAGIAPRKHLALLFQHSFKMLKHHLDRYYSSMIFSNSPGLAFDDLWMAFRPGDLLCQKVGEKDRAMRLASMRKSTNQWLLTTLVASFDGSAFGYQPLFYNIQQYDGYMSLDQLPIFPLKYHSYSEELRFKLGQRGRTYVSLCGTHFKQYTGIAQLSIPPDASISVSCTEFRWKDIHVSQPIYIQDKVFLAH